jgi:hypothetical protein
MGPWAIWKIRGIAFSNLNIFFIVNIFEESFIFFLIPEINEGK